MVWLRTRIWYLWDRTLGNRKTAWWCNLEKSVVCLGYSREYFEYFRVNWQCTYTPMPCCVSDYRNPTGIYTWYSVTLHTVYFQKIDLRFIVYDRLLAVRCDWMLSCWRHACAVWRFVYILRDYQRANHSDVSVIRSREKYTGSISGPPFFKMSAPINTWTNCYIVVV